MADKETSSISPSPQSRSTTEEESVIITESQLLEDKQHTTQASIELTRSSSTQELKKLGEEGQKISNYLDTKEKQLEDLLKYNKKNEAIMKKSKEILNNEHGKIGTKKRNDAQKSLDLEKKSAKMIEDDIEARRNEIEFFKDLRTNIMGATTLHSSTDDNIYCGSQVSRFLNDVGDPKKQIEEMELEEGSNKKRRSEDLDLTFSDTEINQTENKKRRNPGRRSSTLKAKDNDVPTREEILYVESSWETLAKMIEKMKEGLEKEVKKLEEIIIQQREKENRGTRELKDRVIQLEKENKILKNEVKNLFDEKTKTITEEMMKVSKKVDNYKIEGSRTKQEIPKFGPKPMYTEIVQRSTEEGLKLTRKNRPEGQKTVLLKSNDPVAKGDTLQNEMTEAITSEDMKNIKVISTEVTRSRGSLKMKYIAENEEDNNKWKEVVTRKMKSSGKKLDIEVIELKQTTGIIRLEPIDENVSEEQFCNMIADELKDQNVLIEKIKENIKIIKKSRIPYKKGKSLYYCRINDAPLAELIISRELFAFGIRGTCKATETILVTPCTLCGDYSHGKNFCPSKTENMKPICFRCGAQDHIRSACKNPPRCVVCEKKKIKDTKHMVGELKCPTYIKTLNIKLLAFGYNPVELKKDENETPNNGN